MTAMVQFHSFLFKVVMNPNSPFTVNIAAILTAPTISGVVKRVATTVSGNPYITVGNFLQSLSADDLDYLVECCDTVMTHTSGEDEVPSDEAQEALQTITLITSLLLAAESTILLTPDVITEHANHTMMFVALEHLSRTGQVNITYDNLAYGDNDDLPIAQKVVNA